jgi:hypothetical protein
MTACSDSPQCRTIVSASSKIKQARTNPSPKSIVKISRNRTKTATITAAWVIVMVTSVNRVFALPSLGLQTGIASETAAPGNFPLEVKKQAAPILLDQADWPGVLRAGADLQADVERVTGIKPELVTNGLPDGKFAVIVGTLGKSPVMDGLVKSGKLNAEAIAGKWESFLITTVTNPLPGINEALVIAGSDKRGTIYGIYEVSEQIGVSPWYWWADVPPQHHPELFIKSGTYVQGPPVVKYRGIFINDEEPCFGPWARQKFDGINSKMYAHMFELLLRLRANYLWPAMWGKAFNEDDPLNPKVADEYGIVMGSSHHEPMIRAQQEWTKHHREYGNGEWNYLTNEEGLKKFWTDGIERNKKFESLVTIGMRGDGDVAMPDAGGLEANKKLLEKIITDQREILAKHLNTDVTKAPQLWALFTEVQQYYDAGLKLPDDVTLLFCDDNVGNLRRLPTPEERKRSGGAGIYFHMDMHGGPFSYQWLNSSPLPKIQEQMNLAYEYGATRIWIANVGDLKPLEVPIEFFIRMAWNPAAMTKDDVANYQLRWAEREFGKQHAAEIADIVSKYAKYNGIRKPDLLNPNVFSLVNYREAELFSAAWNDLIARARKLNQSIPEEQKDAYYELVLHPTEACGNLVNLYIAAGRNALFAKQGRASANAEAALVRELFKRDQDLSDYYNNVLAGGKWHHMMDQTHIGYTSWDPPRRNNMPKVTELTLPDTAEIGVAVDGSTSAWPGGDGRPALPEFDSLNPQRSYIDVFARGTQPIEFEATARQPWIVLKEDQAPGAGRNRRVWVDVDWNKAPVGQMEGAITINGSTNSVTVKLTAIKAGADQVRESQGCFGGLIGPISFLAADATTNIPAGVARWESLPDYGRVSAAMEVFPVTTGTIQPPTSAPHLEYPIYFARAGTYDVDLITSPTLDVIPTRGLGVAVSIDDQPPQVVNVFTSATFKDEDFLGRTFGQNTRNNARTMRFKQTISAPGKHTLKINMVDPTVVLMKIILHDAPLPASYFGPPETSRHTAGAIEPLQ